MQEPQLEGIDPNLSFKIKPGCPECVHNHWRWGLVVKGGEGNGNLIGLPPGSTQDLDLAIVKYSSSPEELHPTNYKDLLRTKEFIRHGVFGQPLLGLSNPFDALDPLNILLHSFTFPDDVVLWYSASGHETSDKFFSHGFFFNPSDSSPSAPVARAASATASPDGPTTVTFAELYQGGSTTFTDVDPSTVAPLPPGYTALNNAGYDLTTNAIVSGPHAVALSVASVTDQTVFNNLRVFHAENDPLEPSNAIWVDRTILSPDTPAPDFTNKTISARVMGLGKFVVAQLTQPQPANTAVADIAVSSSHIPDPVVAGNNLTSTLTVTNNGPQSATSATLVDGLDPNVEIISATSTQGTCAEIDGSVVCKLGTLAAGASATITIVVKPIKNLIVWPAGGDTIGNAIFVAARENDNALSNNTLSEDILVLPDSNAAPTVSITSPTTGSSFTSPASVTITATATDTDGTIDRVDFYDNGNLIGAGTSSGTNQYSITWSNAPAGIHALIAAATDNGGKLALSTRVNITVNGRFTASIVSPSNNALLSAPANINIVSNASNLDGSISKVDFYANGSLLGTGAPSGANQFSFAWNNVSSGGYSLTAVATNDVGGTVTSDAVYLVVNVPPVVSITSSASGLILTAPANVTITANASDSDGYVRGVDFFASNALIGTNTSVGTGTQQYSFTWNNAPAGTYSLKAVARDSSGASTDSTPVSITVNAPPTVSITSPANASVFAAPATISIVSNAADPGGSISRVDFYANGLLIGAGTSAGAGQYSFSWNNVSAGGYSLTAIATDNLGTATTSSPVSVTVTAPPTVSITSPTIGAIFTAPVSITINANASDSDGSISKVEFYASGSFLGQGTVTGTNQYSFTWNNVRADSYSLTAVAADNLGIQTTSAAVNITVKAQALFVVGSTTLNSADAAIKTRLENLNFVVTAKDAGTAVSADANGKAVVVISSTVSPTTLGTKFRDVTVPVVMWESGSFFDMGMVPSGNTNSGTTTNQTQVNITNASHPLAGGLSGTVTVTTTSSSFSWGKPNANVISIATLVGDATRIVVFGYEKGASMPGLIAPARRIGLFMSDTTAASFNNNGWALFDAAIKWASNDAVLSGSLIKSRPASVIDLTAEGAVDWAHWGLNSASGFDHNAGVTQQISNYTLIGTQPIQQIVDNPVGFSWTNGTPTANSSNTTTAVSSVTVGEGFQITVPADTTLKTIRLYVGVYLAQAKIQATLSDNNAPMYIDSSLTDNQGTTNGVYTISFRAASNGQTLTIKYTVSGFFIFLPPGKLTYAAATLFNGYPPTVSITSPQEGQIYNAPVNITINANAGDTDGSISKVDFYAGSTLLGTSTTSPYSFTWNNVLAGSYALTARATDNSGLTTTSAPINIKVNPPEPIPAAPSNVTATAASKSQINLAWVDNATNEAGFKIERSTDNITFAQIATVGANVTSYQDTHLTASATYYYRVRAYNGSGDSAYSNTVSATTPAR